MAKAATVGELSVHNALHFGSVPAGSKGSMVTTKKMKRKTPSELRGEWLKSRLSVETIDDSPSLTGDLKPKSCDSSNGPRFTRMDEHYPVTKLSRLLSRKENTLKETVSKDIGSCQLRSSAPLCIVSEKQEPNLRPEETVTSESGNASNLGNSSIHNFNVGTFKTVRELSLCDEKSDCSLFVDMGTALKGLVSHEPLVDPAPFKETADISGNSSRGFFTETSVSTKRIPLDFSLKSKMHLLSSSSVSWFHRLINSATINHTTVFQSGDCQPNAKSELLSPGALHSWVHPQVSLPREAISALASASGDFLDKRQQAWEDSFRCLYYMLRKRICKIFYVCSLQFVVMFTLSDGSNQTKHSCCAYISQSTRNLRSLLKHDVLFSMPLCCSKMEEGTAEDLVELSEIERHNLGQTRVPDAIPGVDNTPQSLLMFTGQKNVHALYDFILNYRFLLTTLTGGDVPVLYSPVPFENAALSAPGVKCKQVRKVGYISSQQKDSISVFETRSGSAAGICYSVEIQDAFIPPWVICGICDTMHANGADFQASFVTDPMSIGLNFAIDNAASNDCGKEDEKAQHFGISNTSLFLQKRRAYLKGLKYSDGSYTATLSPVE